MLPITHCPLAVYTDLVRYVICVMFFAGLYYNIPESRMVFKWPPDWRDPDAMAYYLSDFSSQAGELIKSTCSSTICLPTVFSVMFIAALTLWPSTRTSEKPVIISFLVKADTVILPSLVRPARKLAFWSRLISEVSLYRRTVVVTVEGIQKLLTWRGIEPRCKYLPAKYRAHYTPPLHSV